MLKSFPFDRLPLCARFKLCKVAEQSCNTVRTTEEQLEFCVMSLHVVSRLQPEEILLDSDGCKAFVAHARHRKGGFPVNDVGNLLVDPDWHGLRFRDAQIIHQVQLLSI